MALSARDRQRLDFMPDEHRLGLLAVLAELAPLERRMRRADRLLVVAGLLAIGAGAFAALNGFGLWGWGLAAVNALAFYVQSERRHQRRAEYDWMTEVGDYLAERDQ